MVDISNVPEWGHPSSEAVREVAEYFLSIKDRCENPILNMSDDLITRGGCGTAACHGGWYAMKIEDVGWKLGSGASILVHGDGADTADWHSVKFWHGADLMAKDLGFENMEFLKIWAEENPDIWGNKYGAMMFHSGGRKAFGVNPGIKTTLEHIGRHWMAVADRLAELEIGQ